MHTSTVPEKNLYGTVPLCELSRISAAKQQAQGPRPNTVYGTVSPTASFEREAAGHANTFTVKEVSKLIESARSRGRYGHRDATMILVAYRHGLRASELYAFRWDQVDLERGSCACGVSRTGSRLGVVLHRAEADPRRR